MNLFSGPDHPPKKFGLARSRLLGRLAGREAFNKDDDIMGDLAYCKRKEGSVKARKGLAFTLRAPKPKLDILVNFFSYPYLY